MRQEKTMPDMPWITESAPGSPRCRLRYQRRALLALACAGILTLGLAGCKNPPKFDGNDITGSPIGRDMAMVDSSGHLRTLADYRGKVLVVYFGYTHCPDVCPTAMAELAAAMRMLGSEAKKVQVIMITVDPARDTGPVMQTYAQAFYPSFIGLTGTAEQLRKTARSFGAYYAKGPEPTPGNYSMNHSSSFYLLDQQGKPRVLLPSTAPAKYVVHDIRQLF